jgi:hypothetical protein
MQYIKHSKDRKTNMENRNFVAGNKFEVLVRHLRFVYTDEDDKIIYNTVVNKKNGETTKHPTYVQGGVTVVFIYEKVKTAHLLTGLGIYNHGDRFVRRTGIFKAMERALNMGRYFSEAYLHSTVKHQDAFPDLDAERMRRVKEHLPIHLKKDKDTEEVLCEDNHKLITVAAERVKDYRMLKEYNLLEDQLHLVTNRFFSRSERKLIADALVSRKKEKAKVVTTVS